MVISKRVCAAHLNDDHDQIFRALAHQSIKLAIGGDLEHEPHQHGNVRIDDGHLGAGQLVKHLRDDGGNKEVRHK